MKNPQEIKKTHIIALTPSHCDLDANLEFRKLRSSLGQNIFPWLHLTIAQYTTPTITPTVCFQLKKLAATSHPIMIHIEGLDFWKKSEVLFLHVRKDRELLALYQNIRNIFWRFFPNSVLKNWHLPRAFWKPHLSLAYHLDSDLAHRIMINTGSLSFSCPFDTIELRDFDTKYKEYKLNDTK
jgi:2'-5' RNA ligase